MDNEEDAPERTRLVCTMCSSTTWHRVLSEHNLEIPIDIGDDMEDSVYQKWELLACMGCDRASVRVTTRYPWEEDPEYKFYPERPGSKRRKKDYERLPQNLANLYSEVVTAFNESQYLLCTAGVRALLEGLCADQGINEGPNEAGHMTTNLEGRINGLTRIVPEGIVRNLHGLRFLGNQALHELSVPSNSDLSLALIVVEDILNVVYDLNYRAQVLYQKVTAPKPPPLPEDDIPF